MFRKVLGKVVGFSAVVVQYGCLAHCTLEFVGDFVVCSGPSMQPTIYSDDIVLTEHLSVNRKNIDRGDVVIVRSPTNPLNFLCKRVTGVAGDPISSPCPNFTHKFVPRGHVWLEGDNEHNSTDSRTYGPVPYGLIRSRVFHKVWPLGDLGPIDNKLPRGSDDR